MRQHDLADRATWARIRPETTALEGTVILSRFPVAFPPPTFASWSSCSRRGAGSSSRSYLTSGSDPDGASTLRTLKTRPGWPPSIARRQWCSSRPTTSIDLHPAHHNAMSLHQRPTLRGSARRALNEGSSHSPVRSSPRPSLPDGSEAASVSPRRRTPRFTRSARRGGAGI
jgi:hypothetical protein